MSTERQARRCASCWALLQELCGPPAVLSQPGVTFLRHQTTSGVGGSGQASRSELEHGCNWGCDAVPRVLWAVCSLRPEGTCRSAFSQLPLTPSPRTTSASWGLGSQGREGAGLGQGASAKESLEWQGLTLLTGPRALAQPVTPHHTPLLNCVPSHGGQTLFLCLQHSFPFSPSERDGGRRTWSSVHLSLLRRGPGWPVTHLREQLSQRQEWPGANLSTTQACPRVRGAGTFPPSNRWGS